MRLPVFIAAAGALAAQSLTLSTDGLTVYDSVNAVTWVADANLPIGNRFGLPICTGISGQLCIDATGSMNYASAAAWLAAMNAANYLGHNNWQLPTSPLTDNNCGKTGPSGNSFGFGCTAAALASLYNQLGFLSPASVTSPSTAATSLFTNIQPYLYWSQSNASQTTGNFTFSFATGWQGANTLPNFLYLWPNSPSTPVAPGTTLVPGPNGQTVYDPETGATWLANANLPATNAFGLPLCTSPTTPTTCVAKDGSMTWNSAVQYLANMNAAAYLGLTNWQAPVIAPDCPNYGCTGANNPMGNLYYSQLGVAQGSSVVPLNTASTGPFHNLQPYLYWSCQASTVQSPCESSGPATNQEWSYSFGSGFLGTDILPNSLYVIPYFAGARTATTGPTIAEVANAEGENLTIAPNTWVEIKGGNLAPAGDTRIWATSDFNGTQMPTSLDKVSVTVNGKPAFVYYISPSQINILTPPDALSASVSVVVTNNGAVSAAFTAQAQATSPSFFLFNGGPYVAAEHADGSFLGPTTLYPTLTTPAQPGETVVLYANGFGPTNVPVVSGSETQSGTLSPMPQVQIGGVNATVTYAGLSYPGEFQFNVVVPASLGNGDQPIIAAYGGASTPAGALITVQK